jgi:hypothetical protein
MSSQYNVVSFKNCLPKKNKKKEKTDALEKFYHGVVRNKIDSAAVYDGSGIVDCDVAVILGWVHQESKNSPHLQNRKNIITRQAAKGKHVVVIDSSLFLYKNTDNPMHYLRYSFDGVFPTTGNYCDTIVDPTRWIKISTDLGLELKPYRENGNHILLCLQRNGGWSMQGVSVVTWATNTINTIRKYSARPILVRPHPGDRESAGYIEQIKSNTTLTDVFISVAESTLMDDLQHCWAVVNHNSSPAVGAAIEGYPIFVTDPVNSQCREIANTDLAAIENPCLPDRQTWINRLAMSHWSFDDLESGQCWAHMRKFI